MRVLRFHLYFQLSTLLRHLTRVSPGIIGQRDSKKPELLSSGDRLQLSFLFWGYFIFYVAIISYKGEFKIHQNYIEASQDYLFLIKCKLLGSPSQGCGE